MRFTILGSTGFIGKALSHHLERNGNEVIMPARDTYSFAGQKLGHVIYAIGVTGDFRERPEQTIEAHVNILQKTLKNAEFDSWLYLSSTRIYKLQGQTSETSPITTYPSADTLYDLSKLLGESICLAHKNPAVRVARLSNVYGEGQSENTFLGSILQDLKNTGKAVIQESPTSAKDYISLHDVVEILELIALNGKERLYNVASGIPVTHQKLADAANIMGYNISFKAEGPVRAFPSIDTTRIKNEFKIKTRSVLNDLPSLLK